MSIAADLYSLISSDSAVQAICASYGSGSAVFSGRVPSDSECPYVLLTEIGTAEEQENRRARGYQQVFEVVCVVDRDGSQEVARSLAYAVWDAVHRTAFVDAKMQGWFETLGTRQFTDQDGFIGQIMTVVARAWEV